MSEKCLSVHSTGIRFVIERNVQFLRSKHLTFSQLQIALRNFPPASLIEPNRTLPNNAGHSLPRTLKATTYSSFHSNLPSSFQHVFQFYHDILILLTCSTLQKIYVSLQLRLQNRRRKWHFPPNFRNGII